MSVSDVDVMDSSCVSSRCIFLVSGILAYYVALRVYMFFRSAGISSAFCICVWIRRVVFVSICIADGSCIGEV